MKHSILAFGVASLSALALACSDRASTPASPSPLPSETTAASAPDGSTLKATAPALYSPANAAVVSSNAPNLVVANATLTQMDGASAAAMLNYRFVVETAAGAAVASMLAPTTDGTYGSLGITGSRVPENLLQANTTYRWRARAELGSAVGPWSGYWTLKTPHPSRFRPAPARRLLRRPRPQRAGLGPRRGRACRLRRLEVPQYLKATSSLHDREANMAYLRDRMIEVGICGGFDLAWNLKRGVGPAEPDALLWRDGGRDRVIDIAAGFDDYGSALRLHWIEVEGPPGYDRYLPRPTCK